MATLPVWLISLTEAVLLLPVTHRDELSGKELAFYTSMATLPTLSLVASSFGHIFKVGTSSQVAHGGILRWAKTLMAMSLAYLELAKIQNYLPTPSSFLSTFSSLSTDTSLTFLPILAAICLIITVNLEHSYAIQSSARTSIYLSLSIIADILKMFGSTLTQLSESTATIALAALLTKLILLILQELPKRLTRQAALQTPFSGEKGVGFLTRTFSLWIYSTLVLGFYTTINENDLASLGPQFSSKKLLRQFHDSWRRRSYKSTFTLGMTCLSIIAWPTTVATIAHLCNVGFKYAIPLVLKAVLAHIMDPEDAVYDKSLLTFAFAFILIGFALSKSLARHSVNRTRIILRSALVAVLVDKNANLTVPFRQNGGVRALISDVDHIVETMERLNVLMVNIPDIIIGLYCLYKLVGFAIVPYVLCKLVCGLLSISMLTYTNGAAADWEKAIQARTSFMARIFSGIKATKMMGLEKSYSTEARDLCKKEMAAFKLSRRFHILMNCLLPADVYITTGSMIWGCFHWNTWPAGLNPSVILPTLLTDSSIFFPFLGIAQLVPRGQKLWADLNQVCNFLVLPEYRDPRVIRNFRSEHLTARELESLTPDERDARNRCIALQDLSVTAADSEGSVLEHLQISISFGTLTIVSGRAGSGKSLLLKALLGEAVYTKGWAQVATRHMAYCDQHAWLPSRTIQEVVVGECSFDPERYKQVVHACCLEEDNNRPNVDENDTVGTNGAKLSGGQKQRLALARAIYSDALIIVADDVLSSLDIKTARTVFERVFGRGGIIKRQERTAILAINSAEWVEEADLLIHLDSIGGVTTGNKRAIFNNIVAHLKRNAPLVEPTPLEIIHPEPAQQEWDLAIQDEEAMANSPYQTMSLALYRFLIRSLSWKQMMVFHCSPALVAITEFCLCPLLSLWAERDPTNSAYTTWIFMLGLAAILQSLLVFLYIYYRIIPNISTDMQAVFFEAFISAPLPFLTSKHNSALLTRFPQDMTLLSHDLPYGIFLCIYSFAYFVITTVSILFAGMHSIVIILLLLAALYTLQYFYSRSSCQVQLLELKSRAPLYEKIFETTGGVEHIRSFGWTEVILEKSLNLLDQEQKSSYYMSSMRDWLAINLYICSSLLTTALVWAALTLGTAPVAARVGLGLASIIYYTGCPDKWLARWANVRTSLRVVERLKKFVDETQRETDDGIDPAIVVPEDWPSSGDIEFQNVGATYNPSANPRMVLEEVSFSIEDGHTLLIAGQTGSGKSSLFLTLLKCLPYAGTITIDGIDIANVPRERLRRSITTIPQDAFRTSDGTVRDNLFPYDKETQQRLQVTEDEINDALVTVGLFLHVQDHGGHDASLSSMQFSAGQLQLLNVARAILHHKAFKSKVVLLDEITSSLDTGKDLMVSEIVNHEFAKCTVLVISHQKTLDFTGYNARLTLRRGRVLKHVVITEAMAKEQITHAEVERIMVKNRYTAQSTPGSTCGPPDRAAVSECDVRLSASVVSIDTYQTRQADLKTHQLETFLSQMLAQLQLRFAIQFGNSLSFEKLLPMLAQAALTTPLQAWKTEPSGTEQEILYKIEDTPATPLQQAALQRSHNQLIALLKPRPGRVLDVSESGGIRPRSVKGRPGSAVSGATEILSPLNSMFDLERVMYLLGWETIRRGSSPVYQQPALRGYPTPESSAGSSSGDDSGDSVCVNTAGLEQETSDDESDEHDASDNRPEDVSDESAEKEASGDESSDIYSSDSVAVPVPAGTSPPPPPLPRSTPYRWSHAEPPASRSSSSSPAPSSSSSRRKSRFTPPPPSPLSFSRTVSPPSSTSGPSSSDPNRTLPSSQTTPLQTALHQKPRRPLNYAWTRNVLQLGPSKPRHSPSIPVQLPPTTGNRGLFGQIGLGRRPASQLPVPRQPPSTQREDLPWWEEPVRDNSESAKTARAERNRHLNETLVRMKEANRGPRGLQPIYRAFGPAEDSIEAATKRRCRENGQSLPRCWVTARSPFFWVMEVPGLAEDGRPPSIDSQDGDISDRSILSARRFFLNDLLQNRYGSYHESQELLRRIQSGIDLPTGPGYEEVRRMLAFHSPYRNQSE